MFIMKNGVYFAYLRALLNALIVGLSFLFTKKAIELSSPLDTLSFRFTVAFVALSLLILFKIIKFKINIASLIGTNLFKEELTLRSTRVKKRFKVS